MSFAFLDLPVYDRFSALTPRTFKEVSEREGIPLDVLSVVREAMGLAQAEADDQIREDELEVVPLAAIGQPRSTHKELCPRIEVAGKRKDEVYRWALQSSR